MGDGVFIILVNDADHHHIGDEYRKVLTANDRLFAKGWRRGKMCEYHQNCLHCRTRSVNPMFSCQFAQLMGMLLLTMTMMGPKMYS